MALRLRAYAFAIGLAGVSLFSAPAAAKTAAAICDNSETIERPPFDRLCPKLEMARPSDLASWRRAIETAWRRQQTLSIGGGGHAANDASDAAPSPGYKPDGETDRSPDLPSRAHPPAQVDHYPALTEALADCGDRVFCALTPANEFADVAWGCDLEGAIGPKCSATAINNMFDGSVLWEGKILFEGGGHAATEQNSVYAFDLATMRWSRLNDPEPLTGDPLDVPGGNTACPAPPSGALPGHTYGALAAKDDRFYVLNWSVKCAWSKGGYRPSGYVFDLDQKSWIKTYSLPEPMTALVLIGDNAYAVSRRGHNAYRIDLGQGAILEQGPSAPSHTGIGTGCAMSGSIYMLSRGLWRLPIEPDGSFDAGWEDLGERPAAIGPLDGFACAEGRLWFWDGGERAHSLDPDNLSDHRVYRSAGFKGDRVVHTRLTYLPAYRAFVAIPSVGQVLVFRPDASDNRADSASGGTRTAASAAQPGPPAMNGPVGLAWRAMLNPGGTYTLTTKGYGERRFPIGTQYHVGDCSGCRTMEDVQAQLTQSKPTQAHVTVHFHGGEHEWSVGHWIASETYTAVLHAGVHLYAGRKGKLGRSPGDGGSLVIFGDGRLTGELSTGPGAEGLYVVGADSSPLHDRSGKLVRDCSLSLHPQKRNWLRGSWGIKEQAFENVCIVPSEDTVSGNHALYPHGWSAAIVNAHCVSTGQHCLKLVVQRYLVDQVSASNAPPTVIDALKRGADPSEILGSQSLGMTPLDLIACAQGYLGDVWIDYVHYKNGKWATEWKNRRTMASGTCFDPPVAPHGAVDLNAIYPVYFNPESWRIGDPLDPKNPLIKKHFVKNLVIRRHGVSAEAITVTNRGTQPLFSISGFGPKEGSYAPFPFGVDLSTVFFAGTLPDPVWQAEITCSDLFYTGTNKVARPNDPGFAEAALEVRSIACASTPLERRARMVPGSDPNDWPSWQALLSAPQRMDVLDSGRQGH